ncbi:hypothetical protein CPAR01_14998 [Colletotrichum paranaense]|uniref:Uncharacterized protein n=1 Tax=Colletotrichum paranaense TaxID=1914294 RepID=A0ABQ9S0J2_9PEZI|nr:uncharacterized protein CPAR01_14998 [Colletotrichum paranaense]KAK1521475.1 hypothetical protein CPAR01_14998 [Colletotrichum paranaense]
MQVRHAPQTMVDMFNELCHRLMLYLSLTTSTGTAQPPLAVLHHQCVYYYEITSEWDKMFQEVVLAKNTQVSGALRHSPEQNIPSGATATGTGPYETLTRQKLLPPGYCQYLSSLAQ